MSVNEYPGKKFLRIMNPVRECREVIHMKTAYLWSQRSEDPRLKVGAVITTHDLREILAFGYNGPAKGEPPESIRLTPGDSGCLHAEQNAIVYVGGARQGKVMFVTNLPCEMCAKMIVNARIAKVYYSESYRCLKGADVLMQCKIQLINLHIQKEELLQLIQRPLD